LESKPVAAINGNLVALGASEAELKNIMMSDKNGQAAFLFFSLLADAADRKHISC